MTYVCVLDQTPLAEIEEPFANANLIVEAH